MTTAHLRLFLTALGAMAIVAVSACQQSSPSDPQPTVTATPTPRPRRFGMPTATPFPPPDRLPQTRSGLELPSDCEPFAEVVVEPQPRSSGGNAHVELVASDCAVGPLLTTVTMNRAVTATFTGAQPGQEHVVPIASTTLPGEGAVEAARIEWLADVSLEDGTWTTTIELGGRSVAGPAVEFGPQTRPASPFPNLPVIEHPARLVVVEADGSNPRVLSEQAGRLVGWQPDAERVLVQERHEGGDWVIAIDAETGEREPLVQIGDERDPWASSSPDGRTLLLSAGQPRRYQLYDLGTRTTHDLPLQPSSLSLSPDSRRLAALEGDQLHLLGRDGTLLWSTSLAGYEERSRRVRWSADSEYLLLVSWSEILIASAEDRDTNLVSVPEAIEPIDVVSSNDGSQIAVRWRVASPNGWLHSVAVLDTETVSVDAADFVVADFEMPEAGAGWFAWGPVWSADDSTLSLRTLDALHLVDLATGAVTRTPEEVRTLPVHETRDGQFVFETRPLPPLGVESGCYTGPCGDLLVLDAATRAVVHEIGNARVIAVAPGGSLFVRTPRGIEVFDPNSLERRLVWSTGDTGTPYVAAAVGPSGAIAFTEYPESGAVVAVQPDGTRLRRIDEAGHPLALLGDSFVSAGSGGSRTVAIHGLGEVSPPIDVAVPDSAERFGPAPDLRHVAVIGRDGELNVVEVATSAVVWTVESVASRALEWSPDGRRLAYRIPGTDGIFVVDLATQARDVVSTLAYQEVVAFTWEPGGDALDVAHGRRVVRFPLDGGAHEVLVERGPAASVLRWSPDGAMLALGGPSGLSVLDTTGAIRSVSYEAAGGDLYWSPDSASLAFGSEDGGGTFVAGADSSRSYQLFTGHCARLLGWLPDGSLVRHSYYCL